MIPREEEYAQNQVYIPKNRKMILILAGLLVMALLIGAASPVRAEEGDYICLGGMCDVVSATEGPWTLTISPANATNVLPDYPNRIFTITLGHNIDQNPDPLQSCNQKVISVTTTMGWFVESGRTDIEVVTDSTCTFTVTITSNQTGDAVITARKGQPQGVEVSAQQHWVGYDPEPSFTAEMDSNPLVMNGAEATFSINLTNTGNVPLSDPQAMVGSGAAILVGGDGNENGIFDPSEEWQYTFSTPIGWVQNSSTTFQIQASASYQTDRLYQNTSVTYRNLFIGKQITVQKFSDAYPDTLFNVSAQMDGDSATHGPYMISVQEPLRIAVIDAPWTFTEEAREVEDPYAGTLTPVEGTFTYQPGDSGTLYFVNALQYLPVLIHLNLTEHEVEMNLDAGEFNHTLTAIATDQYGEPVPNLEVTFADGLSAPDHIFAHVVTNDAGIANYTVSSLLPRQVSMDAFRDGSENDTYFNNNEIGDSCTLTWTYTAQPGFLTVLGEANVTNYLDYEQFNHTFTLTLTDQYGIPMNNTRVNYTIDYENGTDVSSFDITGVDGNLSITVSSSVPDVARITAEAGSVRASMTKTWTYEIPPTTLTFTKEARDVNGGMLLVGDTIEYTLTVQNTGANPAYFVEVVDNLPDLVTCQDAGGDPSACADPYTWSIGQLDPDTAVSLTINVTINAEAAGQSIINTGTIGGRNFPPIEPPEVCPDGTAPQNEMCSVQPVPVTSLSFSKTAEDQNGGALVIGDLIRYTLTVTNTGNAPAYDVVATDDLPEHVTCLTVGGDATSCNDPLIWIIGTLEPGESAGLPILVSIDEDAVGQSIVNTALVTGGNVNPVDPASVCPDNSTPIEGLCIDAPVPPQVPSTTLIFTKSAADVNGGLLVTGDWIRYTLMVSNNGSTPAYNVLVTDTLPAGLVCQDVQGNPAGCAATILWYIGPMQPGATASLVINTTILPSAAGQSIVNVGLVSGQNFTPVEPSPVCPDGSLPVEGACTQTPVQPETEPQPQVNPPSGGRSGGSYSIIRSSPPILSSGICEPDEHYVEGMGCLHCEEDEVYTEGIGCMQNTTPLMIDEPPLPSGSSLLGTLISRFAYPLLILVLLALLAALLVIGWRRKKQEEHPPAPGPISGGEIGSVTAAEAAYTSIIRVINEIDGQLAALERGIRAAGPLSSQEAAKVAESFFYTSQLAEGVLKDPEIRQYLSAQQVAHLQTQLEIAVQKMHALSRQSENLLNAVQMQYVQAQV